MYDTRGVMVAPEWLVSHRVRRFESGVLVVQSLSHDETAIIRDTEAVVRDDRKSHNTQCHTHVHVHVHACTCTCSRCMIDCVYTFTHVKKTTAPVLKAGHPGSCLSLFCLCVFYVVMCICCCLCLYISYSWGSFLSSFIARML